MAIDARVADAQVWNALVATVTDPVKLEAAVKAGTFLPTSKDRQSLRKRLPVIDKELATPKAAIDRTGKQYRLFGMLTDDEYGAEVERFRRASSALEEERARTVATLAQPEALTEQVMAVATLLKKEVGYIQYLKDAHSALGEYLEADLLENLKQQLAKSALGSFQFTATREGVV